MVVKIPGIEPLDLGGDPENCWIFCGADLTPRIVTTDRDFAQNLTRKYIREGYYVSYRHTGQTWTIKVE